MTAASVELAVDPRAPRPTGLAAVLGLGSALPQRSVPSEEVAARIGVDAAWIQRRTGIQARRRAGPEDSCVSLAAAAGRAALDDAGATAEQLDLVIVATMTPDFATPQVAPLVAAALGAPNAGAFDVGAACSGWLSALGTAAALLETGRASCALVVGVEIMSRVVDETDRGTAPLFGDGAGAVVLGAGDGGVGPVVLGSDGDAAEHIVCPLGGVLRMDGHATFRRAVEEMSEAAREACRRAQITLDEVDLVVPHQANARIIAGIRERLGLPAERMLDAIAETGNTSAASLPIALTEAAATGRLAPGSRVLLVAFGAGLTWGAALVDWGGSAAQ